MPWGPVIILLGIFVIGPIGLFIVGAIWSAVVGWLLSEDADAVAQAPEAQPSS